MNTEYTGALYICAEPCFIPLKNVEIFWTARAGVEYVWMNGHIDQQTNKTNNTCLNLNFPTSLDLLNTVGIRLKFKHM